MPEVLGHNRAKLSLSEERMEPLSDRAIYTCCEMVHYLAVSSEWVNGVLGHNPVREFGSVGPSQTPHACPQRCRSEMGATTNPIAFSFSQIATLFVCSTPARTTSPGAEASPVTPAFVGELLATLAGIHRKMRREMILGIVQALRNFLNEPDRAILDLALARIDFSAEGVPLRLYPFSRPVLEDCPRLIVIDPAIRFGRPTLVGRGLPTDMLFERFQAGDSVALLAEDYDLPVAEVEEAIRYESLGATTSLV